VGTKESALPIQCKSEQKQQPIQQLQTSKLLVWSSRHQMLSQHPCLHTSAQLRPAPDSQLTGYSRLQQQL
jgi:hypothetical protein